MEDNISLFRRLRISSRRRRARSEPQLPVPTGPKNPLTFSFFPPELREQIFIRCLEWNGKTPALVVAARGDKQLYEEIIEIFYRTENTFVLHRANRWSFGNMSQRALLSVRKLKIVAIQREESIPGSHVLRIIMGIPWPINVNPAINLTNLQELHVKCSDTNYCPESTLMFLQPGQPQRQVLGRIDIRHFWDFAVDFQYLNKITFGLPFGTNYYTLESAMSDMVREANWLLGVNGKLTMVRDYGSVEWYKPDEWVWHAERGGFPWDGMHKPNSNARMGARTQELEGVDGTEERHGLGADG